MKHWILLIALLGIAVTGYTQPVGKGTDLPIVVKKEELKPFQYLAVDPEFWQEVQDSLKEENYTETVALGAQLQKKVKDSTEEYEEAALAIGMGLSRLNISYAATKIFIDIAKRRIGTKLAEQALLELDLIARKFTYDKWGVGEDLLTSNEFGEIHPDIQSFVSFHSGIYNLTHGYSDWANAEFKKIQKDSYWDFELQYLTALGEVARNRVDSAKTMLDGLIQSEKTAEDQKTKSKLQVARIYFEKGEFDKAHELYYNLDLPIREKGRVLLERAWAKYYLKDYSKALGLLGVLKAPYFQPSLVPERYVLEMLIYKQLCHYEAVIDTANQFRKIFEKPLEDIKKRRPLESNFILASTSLLDQKFQYWANFIQLLRDEKELLKEQSWSSYRFYNESLREYDLKDKQVRNLIQRDLDEKSRKVADDLIDTEEQISFLDYTAKLDQLRIVRRGEDRNYESEKITYLTFDKIFWPIQGEYWWDELEDYQVLLKSRCGEEQPLTRPPQELDKEFK